MSIRRHHVAAFASLTLPFTLWLAAARGQAYTAVIGKEAIPREGYKSWSLFLVTNQSWLTHELAPAKPPARAPVNADWVLSLYNRARTFGRVIGNDHLAVWFWKTTRTLPNGAVAAENVDVERAIAFCEKLKLKPSEGPYLLFTTTYPDETTPPSAFTVITLGPDADRIDRLLTRLGDQLVTEGVIRQAAFTQPSGTDAFWSAWFNATRQALVNLGLDFRVATRTPTLSLDSGTR
jgi:hypothetical protein